MMTSTPRITKTDTMEAFMDIIDRQIDTSKASSDIAGMSLMPAVMSFDTSDGVLGYRR